MGINPDLSGSNTIKNTFFVASSHAAAGVMINCGPRMCSKLVIINSAGARKKISQNSLSENGGGGISPSVENTRYFRKIFFRSRDKMFDNLLLLFFPAPVYGGVLPNYMHASHSSSLVRFIINISMWFSYQG